MRGFWLRKALLLGGYLLGHECVAQQRTPIPLLQPTRPVAVVPTPGVMVALGSGSVLEHAALPPMPAPAHPAAPQGPSPLLLLDTRLIIGANSLAKVNPQDIQSIRLYKQPAGTPEPWGELLRNGLLSGIIDMTFKKPLRLPSQRLAQLGHRLRAKHATYLLNGVAVTNTRLRIATSAIQQVTLSNTPTGPVVSVQVSSMADIPPTSHPPGTIMIRGAAAYQTGR
jgi:hypothetical protein